MDRNPADLHEANNQCTAGTAWNGWLGQFCEGNGINGPNRIFASAPRIYKSNAISPAGDVDWFRFRFAEHAGCSFAGFVVSVTLQPPRDTEVNFCARLYDPGSPASVPCAINNDSAHSPAGG